MLDKLLDELLDESRIINKEFDVCKNLDIRVSISDTGLFSSKVYYFVEVKSKNKWLNKLMGGEYYEISLNNYVFEDVNKNITKDIFDVLTKLNLVLDTKELDKFLKSIDFTKYEENIKIKIREKK